MLRKFLEFFGFVKPAVDLPCNPCHDLCNQPEDCAKTEPAIPPVLVEPAVVEEFYKQDVPPAPLTPVVAEKVEEKVEKKEPKKAAKKAPKKKEPKVVPAGTATAATPKKKLAKKQSKK